MQSGVTALEWIAYKSHMVALSAYPPSFEGNPWTYGLALFGLTLVCALAAAKLMQFLFDARAIKALREIRGLYPVKPFAPLPFANPLTIYRSIISCFLITVLLGAFPDVLLLFTWGEGGPTLIDTLFLIDRICDAMTIIPFATAMILLEWGSQVVPQQLVRRVRVSMRRPNWQTFKHQTKIAAVVFVIALGVTLAKASAGP